MNYIDEVKKIVTTSINNSNQSIAHRIDHIERVMKNAYQIAESCSNVDKELLTLAVLLHDVRQPFDNKANHVKLSRELARSILKKVGYPKDRLESVIRIINEHSTETVEHSKPSSIEAAILFDADKIDGLGATGVARVLSLFGQMGKHPLDAISWYRMKIDRSLRNLQTKKGKEIFEKRLQFVEAFLQMLEDENINILSPNKEAQQAN